ncbi:YihY/virulence factor BrkB family protein [Paludifilum halophilum]|uniref:Uncharacterized protein n=1 Tax=Paludifilum halophilum TaxID=1642702 RepID=A0A235B4H6_9BACL|nr:YihY/virulence factor BrkB family protein [Paludifilum halophilum]OYD06807.1 hypothetical protein CHM34_14740 [Paludifilum halophilum]
MSQWKKIKSIIKRVFASVFNEGIFDLAAALAYYFLLSIFPLLIFLVALLPYLSIDTDQAIRFVKDIVPEQAARSIDQPIREVVEQRRGGILSTSLLATLWIASNAVGGIIRTLNVAYQVDETRSIIQVKLLSIAMTIAFVLVFTLMLVLPVFGQLIFSFVQRLVPLPAETVMLFSLFRWLVVFVIITLVLIGIYQTAPNVTLPLREVTVGALVATGGWQLISLGFSYYVNNFSHYSATYGSLGGVIVLMIWFYLAGLILVFGGVVNASIHQQRLNRQR